MKCLKKMHAHAGVLCTLCVGCVYVCIYVYICVYVFVYKYFVCLAEFAG